LKFRILMMGTLALVAGCSSMSKMGKVEEFAAPGIDARTIRRISLIAAGVNRGDRQVVVRARERLGAAGITLVTRSGEWGSNADALKEICVQRPDATDNVDGVLFVAWDNLVLHQCPSGTVAATISGNYAGIDVLVDRLMRHLGVALPPDAK
jgi:hypothetical protein